MKNGGLTTSKASAATRQGASRAGRAKLARVGVFVNLEKEAACAAVTGLCRWLVSKNLEVYLLREQARALGKRGGVAPETFFRKPQLIVSLGGDGTFLHVARHITGVRPALLGVNFGRLGFLTAVESGELIAFFERLLKGPLPVEHRLRLQCRVASWTQPPMALNDVVIQDAGGVRAIRVRLSYGTHLVGVFRADGVIIATPTGSTAYTLSVGGPVVHPGVEAFLVALISPHTLSARPLVIGADEELTIEVLGERPLRVTVDGQESRTIPPHEVIRVARAPAQVTVVVDPERSFLYRLREKLAWGGTPTV
jgi:NAD+ kinase